MAIMRPGEAINQDTSYEDYLAGTEEYKQEKEQEYAERFNKPSSIRRGNIYTGKDYKARNIAAKYAREAEQLQAAQAVGLKQIDEREYTEAMQNKPIFEEGESYEDYTQELNEWTGKYGDVLGRGEERYNQSSAFLEQQKAILDALDVKQYEEALQSKPVYSNSADEYAASLSTWADKYGNVLGRGTERYEQTSSELEAEYSKIPQYRVQEALSPLGLNRNITNPEEYDVEYYTTGNVKSIKAKPKQYVSMMQTPSAGGRKTVSKYIPYEVHYDKSGNKIKELVREVNKNRFVYGGKGAGQTYWYTPYVKGELTYKNNAPDILKSYKVDKTNINQGGFGAMGSWKPYLIKEVEFDPNLGIGKSKEYDIYKGMWKATSKTLPESGKTIEGGQSTYASALKNVTDYSLGTATVYQLPQTQSDLSGYTPWKYRQGNVDLNEEKQTGNVVSWYNPMTGMAGNVYGSVYRAQQESPLIKGPTASKITGKSNVIRNPSTGKWQRWNYNPMKNKAFGSYENFSTYWNAMGPFADKSVSKINKILR